MFCGIEKILKTVTQNPMKNTNLSLRIDLKFAPPRKKIRKLKKKHEKSGISKSGE